MSWFSLAFLLHLLVAVLGVGTVSAIPLSARFARRAGAPSASHAAILTGLFRAARLGFALAFVSGVLVEASTLGAFHAAPWFRLSIALMLVLAFTHARGARALRASHDASSLVSVERWGWASCATVALLIAVMIGKPFS